MTLTPTQRRHQRIATGAGWLTQLVFFLWRLSHNRALWWTLLGLVAGIAVTAVLTTWFLRTERRPR